MVELKETHVLNPSHRLSYRYKEGDILFENKTPRHLALKIFSDKPEIHHVVTIRLCEKEEI